MTDKPILFSGPMVRALLDGSKTQTRRLLSEQHIAVVDDTPSEMLEHLELDGWSISDGTGDCMGKHLFKAPIAIGDRLYVREHWKAHPSHDDLSPSEMSGEESIKFLSDGFVETWGWGISSDWGRHRQAMHMPRWASRLTLTVTDVRVQRVWGASASDPVAG